jgi:hypothetical protein
MVRFVLRVLASAMMVIRVLASAMMVIWIGTSAVFAQAGASQAPNPPHVDNHPPAASRALLRTRRSDCLDRVPPGSGWITGDTMIQAGY